MLCGMLEMKTAAMKLRLIGKRCSDLNPENDRLGHAVDDRADDDAHRAPYARLAEARLHSLVCEQKHGHADQHPEGELPAVEHVLGLADEVEGDGCDQRPGAEAGQDPHEARRHVDPAGEQAGKQQRRRAEQSQAECLNHASLLAGSPGSPG